MTASAPPDPHPDSPPQAPAEEQEQPAPSNGEERESIEDTPSDAE